jgi:ribosomal protein L25 (general stress protein Ctc)
MSKEIMVSTRTESGKGAMGRARKNGQVPCVLYGRGSESVMLFASVGELDSAKFAKGDEHHQQHCDLRGRSQKQHPSQVRMRRI